MRLTLCCILLGLSATLAPAADMGSGRLDAPPIIETSSVCAEARYVGRIIDRFNWVQAKTWDDDDRLVAITDIREIAYKGVEQGNYIPKVFCQGTAQVSTDDVAPNMAPGKSPLPTYPLEGEDRFRIRNHKVAFIVAEEAGFVGLRPDVTWCVAGYDWFNLHEPACRVLNPY